MTSKLTSELSEFIGEHAERFNEQAASEIVQECIMLINRIKSHIKRENVDKASVPLLVSCFSNITREMNSEIVKGSTSCLGHLIRRLSLQDIHCLEENLDTIIDCLLSRLADERIRLREVARGGIYELWKALPKRIESIVCQSIIETNPAIVRSECIGWLNSIIAMHENLDIVKFLPNIANALCSEDILVANAAAKFVLDICQNSSSENKETCLSITKEVLQKKAPEFQLHVDESMASAIRCLLPRSTSDDGLTAKYLWKINELNSSGIPVLITADDLRRASTLDKVEALEFFSVKEMDQMLSATFSCFEGKETEANWNARENAALKLRRIIRGTFWRRHIEQFLHESKGITEGILKCINSLRTTLCTAACLFIHDFIIQGKEVASPFIGTWVQSMIKLCGGTKKITANLSNENMKIAIIYCQSNSRLSQAVFAACYEKNSQLRVFASSWMQNLLSIQVLNETLKGWELDNFEAFLKKGVTDAESSVRANCREMLFLYSVVLEERYDQFMGSLDTPTVRQLKKYIAQHASSVPEKMIAQLQQPSSGLKQSLHSEIPVNKLGRKKKSLLPTNGKGTSVEFSRAGQTALSISAQLENNKAHGKLLKSEEVTEHSYIQHLKPVDELRHDRKFPVTDLGPSMQALTAVNDTHENKAKNMNQLIDMSNSNSIHSEDRPARQLVFEKETLTNQTTSGFNIRVGNNADSSVLKRVSSNDRNLISELRSRNSTNKEVEILGEECLDNENLQKNSAPTKAVVVENKRPDMARGSKIGKKSAGETKDEEGHDVSLNEVLSKGMSLLLYKNSVRDQPSALLDSPKSYREHNSSERKDLCTENFSPRLVGSLLRLIELFDHLCSNDETFRCNLDESYLEWLVLIREKYPHPHVEYSLSRLLDTVIATIQHDILLSSFVNLARKHSDDLRLRKELGLSFVLTALARIIPSVEISKSSTLLEDLRETVYICMNYDEIEIRRECVQLLQAISCSMKDDDYLLNTILQNLNESQKNLLTYYFTRNSNI